MDGCLNWEMRIHDSQLVCSCVCLLCVYICVCNIYSCRQITHNKYVFKPYQSCLMKVSLKFVSDEKSHLCVAVVGISPQEPTFGSTKNFTLHYCVLAFTKISDVPDFKHPHLLRPKWNSGSFGRVDHAIRKAERNVTKVNSPTHHPRNDFGPFNSSMWSFSQTSTNFWMFAIQRTVQLAF